MVSLPPRRAALTMLLRVSSWAILLPLLPLRWLLCQRLHVMQLARVPCAVRHVCLHAAGQLLASRSLAVSLSRTALVLLQRGLRTVFAHALAPKHHSCLHAMLQTSPTCASMHVSLHAADPPQGSRSLAVPLSPTVPRPQHGPKPASAAALLPSLSHLHHQQKAKVRAHLMESKGRSQ